MHVTSSLSQLAASALRAPLNPAIPAWPLQASVMLHQSESPAPHVPALPGHGPCQTGPTSPGQCPMPRTETVPWLGQWDGPSVPGSALSPPWGTPSPCSALVVRSTGSGLSWNWAPPPVARDLEWGLPGPLRTIGALRTLIPSFGNN